jgi:hypothetical protein
LTDQTVLEFGRLREGDQEFLMRIDHWQTSPLAPAE